MNIEESSLITNKTFDIKFEETYTLNISKSDDKIVMKLNNDINIYKNILDIDYLKTNYPIFDNFENIDKIYETIFQNLKEEDIKLTKIENKPNLNLKLNINNNETTANFILERDSEKNNNNNDNDINNILTNYTKNIIDPKINKIKNEFLEILTKIDKKLENNNNLNQQIKNIEINVTNIQKNQRQIDLKMDQVFLNTVEDLESVYNSIGHDIISDIKHLYLINSGIKNNFNKFMKGIKLIYKCTRDGDNSNDFHNHCDNIPNILTVILTTKGKSFGAFNNQPFINKGNNKFYTDQKAFLFSFDNYKIYYTKPDGEKAIGYHSAWGPAFGSGGGNELFISGGCLSNNSSFESSTPKTFVSKGKGFTLNGENHFQVKEYEVYEIIF